VVSGCVRNGEYLDGLRYLVEMVRLAGDGGARPNSRTMESGLEACGVLRELPSGRCLHGYALKAGVADCTLVVPVLFSMYSKCDNTVDASVLFTKLPDKDMLSWTSLIGAYCRKGFVGKALELLQEMEERDLQPDEVLVSCLLAGMGNTVNACGGKVFHVVIMRRNLGDSVLIGNGLISMYCKFALVDVAGRIFWTMHQ
jgi:pentatricopeptide repeat protein